MNCYMCTTDVQSVDTCYMLLQELCFRMAYRIRGRGVKGDQLGLAQPGTSS